MLSDSMKPERKTSPETDKISAIFVANPGAFFFISIQNGIDADALTHEAGQRATCWSAGSDKSSGLTAMARWAHSHRQRVLRHTGARGSVVLPRATAFLEVQYG